MNHLAVRLSHAAVRITATVTLLDLGLLVAVERFSPAFSHRLANSLIGNTLVIWSLITPLLIIVYVGVEFWWMRNSKTAARDLKVDAALAVACFLSLCAFALYVFTHYAPI
jgi:hypothetical protein